MAASLIAADFYEAWWSQDEFQDSREKYADTVSEPASALKVEVSRYVDEMVAGMTVPIKLTSSTCSQR
jgi:hypothetical protein